MYHNRSWATRYLLLILAGDTLDSTDAINQWLEQLLQVLLLLL